MILPALMAFLAAFIRAISGFGFALVLAPLLTLITGAQSVVVIVVILSTISNIMVLFHITRDIDLRNVTFLGLGGIFGVPLGAYLLSTLDPSAIKLAIAVLVIPFSVLLLLGHSHRFKRNSLGCTIAGFMGGVLGASTSISGPPVVLFLVNQGLIKERFVGTLAAYFLVINVLSISAFQSLGIITIDDLIKIATSLPTLYLGTYIGVKLLPKINATLFRIIALSIVSTTALIIMVKFLLGL